MVLGMRYDSSFNYAMAGLYRTAVAVSALIILLSASVVYAADPPVSRSNVSVNVNPTTGYYSSTSSTVRLPNGVSVSPSTATPPVVSKYSGGLQQTMPAGITIDAIKKSAPLPVVARAKTSSLKTAAKGLFRGGVAGLVLGAGLDALLDGIGALIDEGGTVRRVVYDFPPSDNWCTNVDNICAATPQAVLDAAVSIYPAWPNPSIYKISSTQYALVRGGNYSDWYINRRSTACPDGSSWVDSVDGCAASSSQPFPPAELDDAIDSSYNPEPSDWTNLTPHLSLDDVEITSAPTLQGEPRTTTVFDADGNPHKVTETNIWYDFDIRDNPSPRPALDMKTREETKTYEDGVLTSTTTTNSAASAGSNDTPPPPEPLIDCDLFPTACAWFDWTQEEPTEPDDDLSGLLQEVPIVSETYTITGGVAACPAPMVLDLSVFGSREVSYQPLCDLASTMKYLYLALMSFAAAVLLNRSVNRV